MCNVAAMVALSAAQSGLQYVGQAAQAEATAEYQEKVHAQNTKIANEAAFNQYRGMQQRISQEREARAMDIMKASRQARQAMGAGRAAAGEGGVAGSSVDALLRDFERSEAEYSYGQMRSQQFREAAMMDQMEAIRSQQQGRILSTLPEPVAMPNPLMIPIAAAQGMMQGIQMFGVQNAGTGKIDWSWT